MPSEVTYESPWLVGNAHPRQRGSGHSVVLMTSKGLQTQSWEAVRGRVGTRRQQNGAVVGWM